MSTDMTLGITYFTNKPLISHTRPNINRIPQWNRGYSSKFPYMKLTQHFLNSYQVLRTLKFKCLNRRLHCSSLISKHSRNVLPCNRTHPTMAHTMSGKVTDTFISTN